MTRGREEDADYDPPSTLDSPQLSLTLARSQLYNMPVTSFASQDYSIRHAAQSKSLTIDPSPFSAARTRARSREAREAGVAWVCNSIS